jgi:lipooligosaccharide transport system permease protein
MPSLALLAAIFDWRSRAVLGRNLKVFLRNWKTAMFPPAMEPVVYFVAFGIGLATYVGGVPHAGRTVDYASWVAQGMMAYTAFATPYYEALYSAYVRMFYQKTWDGILATQVEIRHLVWGEVLWAGLRGVSNVTVVGLVLACFSWAGWLSFDLAALPAILLLTALGGCAFAAFALIFTAIVPAIDHMNYPVFLIGLPLSFVSHTYFPIESQSELVVTFMALNPLYHLAETFRSLMLDGRPGPHLVPAAGLCVGLLVSAYLVSYALTVRRVVRES